MRVNTKYGLLRCPSVVDGTLKSNNFAAQAGESKGGLKNEGINAKKYSWKWAWVQVHSLQVQNCDADNK